MTQATRARLVREVQVRAGSLSADELNALGAARSGLLDSKYATADVAALIAAAAAVVLAHSTALVVADLNASVAVLSAASAITASAGGV